MLIEANRLTLGKEPDVRFLDSGLQVTFPAAENHSYNNGTKEDPDWVQTGTSWYNMVAYGDVANEILETLEKGEHFKLIRGVHKYRKVETDDGTDYRAQYKILEFEKIEKKND